MTVQSPTIEVWVETYIRFQSDPKRDRENHPDYWAVERFFDLWDNPKLTWEAILKILDREPPDVVIGILAAGPLEDFIEHHGEDYIETIEKEAQANPDFRHLLGGVWQSSNEDVWARVDKARNYITW